MKKNRSRFTPVQLENCIYLCGGLYNHTVEVFHGVTMSCLSVELPEAGPTLACVYQNTLLIITATSRVVLTREKSSGEVVMSTQEHRITSFPVCSNPVICNGVVFNVEGNKVSMYSAIDGARIR